ncbi:MAG: TIGR04211 family SH3 domain-containing protein [Sulfuricaulis sp.]|nr:TIGR04211 family SH3 domain-containing protein [Sulfuricaulis sp.]
MTKNLCAVLILTLWGMVSAAQAETVYVAERIRIGMRAEVVETSAVVKTIETGVPLEVVERFDRFVHVRDPQGTEGWLEARFLTPDPPTRLQLAKLQEELTKNRGPTAETLAQLKKAQATVAEQALKIKALEKEVADKSSAPPAAAPAPAAPASAPPVGKISKGAGFGFGYLWLVISFAMLGIGFAAGVKWLRESIRKRSGGMYLRI